MNATTYGLDIAKSVFQLYWVEHESGEIHNRKLGKQYLLEFFAQREAGLIALEVCGSAHWWRRKLMALEHEVKLIHAKFIRPFVQGNKTDAADAKAIWAAVRQPEMRTVVGKTEEQQAMLALHRMRLSLIKFRTMQGNQLRGLLYEFGITLKGGRQAGLAVVVEMDGGMVSIVEADATQKDRRKGKKLQWKEANLCLAHEAGSKH